jgi:hypothetical protein
MDPSLRFSLSRFVKEKEEGMGFGWNRETRERYVFVRELKRGGKKGEGELLEQRCVRKRKRGEEEREKEKQEKKRREREAVDQNGEKGKRKEKKEEGIRWCVTMWVVGRRWGNPLSSQSGVDTWQWKVTFYFKTQTFINYIRTPLY